jgi:hypothetical protein
MSWAVTRIERVRTEYAGWNEKCGYQGSGYPRDRGATGFLCGRFSPYARKIHGSHTGALQSTRRGEAGLPLVPLCHAVLAVKAFAREDPRSRAPRRTAAALTAALRRGAFDSGNPAPGH